MTEASDLTVHVEPELADLLRQAVAAGEYASESDAVEAALRSWAGDRMIATLGVDEIRLLWTEGVASGPGVHPDLEEIKAKAREQFGSTKSRE